MFLRTIKQAVIWCSELLDPVVWFVLVGATLAGWTLLKFLSIKKSREQDADVLKTLADYQQNASDDGLDSVAKIKEYINILKYSKSIFVMVLYKYVISHMSFSNIMASLTLEEYRRVTQRKSPGTYNVFITMVIIWTGLVSYSSKTGGFAGGYISVPAIMSLLIPLLILISQIVISVILVSYCNNAYGYKMAIFKRMRETATSFFEPMNSEYEIFAKAVVGIADLTYKQSDYIRELIRKEGLTYRFELTEPVLSTDNENEYEEADEVNETLGAAEVSEQLEQLMQPDEPSPAEPVAAKPPIEPIQPEQKESSAPISKELEEVRSLKEELRELISEVKQATLQNPYYEDQGEAEVYEDAAGNYEEVYDERSYEGYAPKYGYVQTTQPYYGYNEVKSIKEQVTSEIKSQMQTEAKIASDVRSQLQGDIRQQIQAEMWNANRQQIIQAAQPYGVPVAPRKRSKPKQSARSKTKRPAARASTTSGKLKAAAPKKPNKVVTIYAKDKKPVKKK